MAGSQPSGVNPTPEPSKDTGYVPSDDAWTQWRNIFSILSGKMTDEGKEQYRLARDIRNEAADCKRCEDQRDYLLQYSEQSS
jgi:inner membrane protease ATP23